MAAKAASPGPAMRRLTAGEQRVFRRLMVFRLLVAFWAAYVILNDPLDRALFTMIILGFILATGERIFFSLREWAHVLARREVQRARAEARAAASAAHFRSAQQAASEKYFDLENAPSASS